MYEEPKPSLIDADSNDAEIFEIVRSNYAKANAEYLEQQKAIALSYVDGMSEKVITQ